MESDPPTAYHRILLKLSGEALAGPNGNSVDPEAITSICLQIKEISELGVEIALVLGGGNIFRGFAASRSGMNRTDADFMGMLATVINAMAMKDRLLNIGLDVRVLSAITKDAFTEPYVIRKAKHHLDKHRLIILAGGTGNPFFSTDTAAALRASEIGADVLIKATKVDGVYSADPLENENAEFYPQLSYMDVVEKDLKVMDLTAVTMCRENKIPIVVFSMNKAGNLKKAVKGEKVGSIIS
jgi:uridylate kinase